MYGGTMLHDIGKMGLPDSILLKLRPSPDSGKSCISIPVYAFNLLSTIPLPGKSCRYSLLPS
jgi:HD-GYP domain-containing protein (c-di-GMP phosphodiesterase class II)